MGFVRFLRLVSLMIFVKFVRLVRFVRLVKFVRLVTLVRLVRLVTLVRLVRLVNLVKLVRFVRLVGFLDLLELLDLLEYSAIGSSWSSTLCLFGGMTVGACCVFLCRGKKEDFIRKSTIISSCFQRETIITLYKAKKKKSGLDFACKTNGK